MSPVDDVFAGRAPYALERADCLDFLNSLPDDSVSLCLFSPPYSRARLYLEDGQDLGVARGAEEWAAWMVAVFRACARVCTGLIACICDDQTQDYRYGCGPLLLGADLCRAGFNLRRPCIYRRSGIPGSGGPDWLRCDHELILCATRPGRLPWSDPTACGHPPRWAPGGEMSHRLTDGQRVNYAKGPWHQKGAKNAAGRNADGTPHKKHGRAVELDNEPAPEPEEGLFGPIEAEEKEARTGLTKGGNRRNAKGERQPIPVHKASKPHTKSRADGTDEDQLYTPPVLANPGSVIQEIYTAAEVAALLGQPGDVIDCQVGGGQMGSPLAHANEAPFPESLATFFVRSFCPPGGVVCDPFSGSGTVAAVAVRWGRRALGCDLRQSQIDLARRRLSGETPLLFTE